MRCILLLALLACGCRADPLVLAAAARGQLPQDETFATRLCNAALDRTRQQVRYDGA